MRQIRDMDLLVEVSWERIWPKKNKFSPVYLWVGVRSFQAAIHRLHR